MSTPPASSRTPATGTQAAFAQDVGARAIDRGVTLSATVAGRWSGWEKGQESRFLLY